MLIKMTTTAWILNNLIVSLVVIILIEFRELSVFMSYEKRIVMLYFFKQFMQIYFTQSSNVLISINISFFYTGWKKVIYTADDWATFYVFKIPVFWSHCSPPLIHNIWTPPRHLVINLSTVTIYYHAICHDQSRYCWYLIIYSVCMTLWTSDLALYDHKNMRCSTLQIYSVSFHSVKCPYSALGQSTIYHTVQIHLLLEIEYMSCYFNTVIKISL